jgi:hypothetical protein
MSKLPKSSRVDRRKPSKTFNHPYQLNVFDPRLASTLRNVGYIAKTLFPIYAGLIYGYMSSAQHLRDEPSLTEPLFSQSGMLAFILAIIIGLEFLRSLEAFDYTALGKVPKLTFLAIYLAAASYALYALINLPALNNIAHHQRVQQRERAEGERRRKEGEQIAECNALRTREIETLARRRQATYSDHKKCLADWQKPNLFSKETADEACAPKLKEHQQAATAVKAREAKACAPPI